MTGTARIIQGNALNLPLDDASVDLICTSPPYFGLRSYQDAGEHYAGQIGSEATPAEFVDALIAATREMMRVLKPSGSIWVNLGDCYASKSKGTGGTGKSGLMRDGRPDSGRGSADSVNEGAKYAPRRFDMRVKDKSLVGIPWRYALRCIDDLGLILRAEVIWAKPNGLPESVTDRVRRSHEQWFHLTKEPRYFSAVDEIREAHNPVSIARSGRAYNAGDQFSVSTPNTLNPAQFVNPLGKLPGSVWTVPTQPLQVPAELGVDHFAAFPMEWPRRIMRGWSPAGGTVLDPFGGTGTTSLVAKSLGRTGISVDMSADYCRLATWRTTDPGQLATALQVEKPEPANPDQLDLFGEVVA